MIAVCDPHDGGKSRLVCFSKSVLLQSQAKLDEGDWIAAGCLLREALWRFLESVCINNGCLPRKKRDQTCRGMLLALKKHQHVDLKTFGVLSKMIDTGNAAAHCRKVTIDQIQDQIDQMFTLMHRAPEIHFVNWRLERSSLVGGEL
jgi:hypothetical protein